MIGRANQPRDLVWSLENFHSPDNTMKFFNVFKNSFIIYSKAVKKLYCEYNTHVTGPATRRRLVVLPDFNQFESIFNNIDETSIIDTSIRIYPSIKNGQTKLMLSGKASSTGELKSLPLKQGLGALNIGYFDNQQIIPTLMLGDLREFPEKKLPYLTLHSIHCASLTNLSEFERKDIARGAWAKLKQFT